MIPDEYHEHCYIIPWTKILIETPTDLSAQGNTARNRQLSQEYRKNDNDVDMVQFNILNNSRNERMAYTHLQYKTVLVHSQELSSKDTTSQRSISYDQGAQT